MLSRIAENLYWMGRYVERAENTARLLDVNYHAIVEVPLQPGTKGIVTEQWAPLLHILDDEARFREHFERADRNTVPEWLAVSADNPSSIRMSLTHARENARTLRDRISTEMWETLNRAYLELCDGTREDIAQETLHDYCATARESSYLFFGTADATLPRDLGWYFLKAGQYLERTDNVLRILMVRYRQYRGQEVVARGVETHRGIALLKSISAFEAFRKRYHSALDSSHIAEFLLLDPFFPRSVRFSANVVYDVLKEIEARNPDVSAEPSRQAGWLAAQLEYMPSADKVTEEEDPSLESLLRGLASLSDAVSSAYFDYASAQQQAQSQSQGNQNQSQSQSQSGSGSQSQNQSQSGNSSQSQSQSQGGQKQDKREQDEQDKRQEQLFSRGDI